MNRVCRMTSFAGSFVQDPDSTDSERCMIKRLLRKLRRPIPPVVVKCKHVLRDGLFTVTRSLSEGSAFLAAYARGVEAVMEWIRESLARACRFMGRGDGRSRSRRFCGVRRECRIVGLRHHAPARMEEYSQALLSHDTFRGPITAQYSRRKSEPRVKLAEKGNCERRICD